MAAETGKSESPKRETWFSRFLQRLSQVNERQFNGEVPSCCAGKAPHSAPASKQGMAQQRHSQ